MSEENAIQNVDLTTPLPKSAEETDQERATALSPVNNAVSTALGLHAAAALAPKPDENLGLHMPQFQDSTTNAAPLFQSKQAPPAPGSMADRLQRALMAKNLAEGVTSPIFDKLVQSRGAGVALMALAHNAEAATTPDTTSGNTSWDTATSGQDASQPTNLPAGPNKTQQVQQAIAGNFSDLAAATEGEGGALAGAARVAGAEYKRRHEEEKDRVNMALTNAQMLHEQMLIHKLGEDQVNEQAKSGKQAESMALLAPKAELKAEGKTSDELGQMIRDKKVDPTRDMVFLTGRMDMGKDKNGQPMFRSVYSVVTPGGPMTVDADAAKYINGNMPWQKIPEGTNMSAPQFYGLWQQAQNIQASMQAAKKFNDDLDAKDKEAKLTENDQRFFAKTAAMQAVSKFTSHVEDPYGAVKAYNALKIQAATDSKLAAELGPGWEEQFMHAWGNGSIQNFKDMDAEYRKDFVRLQGQIKDSLNEKNAISNPAGTMALAKSEMDSLTPVVTEAQRILSDPKATQADKDEANAKLADANQRMKYAMRMHQIASDTESGKTAEAVNIEKAKQEASKAESVSTVPLTPEISREISSLPQERQSILKQYDSNTQAALMGVAFGDGSTELSVFPSRLTKGAPGITQQQAYGVIHQLNPDWSEQTYKVMQNAYKDATSGALSKQADSLNNFVGHAAEARRINDGFYRLNAKIFNMPVNALAKAGYGQKQVELQEALNVVNGEFQNMVLSGHVPSSDEKEAQAKLVNPDSTVGQVNAALKVMAHMATTRANTMNGNYMRKTGKNFPSLIYGPNADDAKYLGIPVEKFSTTGRVGGSGTAPWEQKAQPTALGGHQVGDTINQNGHQMKVTAVDKDGRVTNAE